MEANVLITICIVKNKLLSDHTKKLTEKKRKKEKILSVCFNKRKTRSKGRDHLGHLGPVKQ